MKFNLALGTLLAISALAAAVPTRSATSSDDHGTHHPSTAVGESQFDKQMQTMPEAHQKLQAARTPDERAALMNEHMKAMQDGMAMMSQMGGRMSMGAKDMNGSMPMKKGEGASEHESMHQRMDMMQMMMQMMMDWQGSVPSATK